MIVKGGATLSRTRIDALGDTAKSFGAKGLAWLKLTAEGQLESVIAKFLDAKAFAAALPEAKPGDKVLFGADKSAVVHDVMGRIRLLLGEELKLIDTSAWKPLWVVDFPMLDYDAEHGPDKGKLIRPNVIIGGTDRVAIDAAGVALLRSLGTMRDVTEGRIFDLDQITRAAELGIGVSSTAEIHLVPLDPASEVIASKIQVQLDADK